MNKLKNCSECGRIFVDTGIGICRDCLDKQEEQMIEVTAYVRDHPHSTVKEIAKEVGVKEKLVRRMIREGRFITEGIEYEYPCERCKKPITEGRFCDACSKEIQQEAVEAQQKAVAAVEKARRDLGTGMHSKSILDKSKKDY